MSDEHEYATIAAELLANRKPEARSRGVDRQHGISVVAQAMAERARRGARARSFKLGALLAVAAGVALIGGWLGARAPAPSAAACSAPSCAGAVAPRFGTVAGRPFEPGQSIVAGRGQATVVEFGPVTRIALDELSELEYRQGDRTQRFRLLSGAVRLNVAKLTVGQRFLVETADAEVEVRGTVFDVALGPADDACASPRTRVSVEEGVVEVRFKGKTSRVQAGESWPVSCDEPRSGATPEPSAKPLATPATADAPRVPSAAKLAPAASSKASGLREPAAVKSGSAPASPPKSGLAEHNDLYAEAASLQRSGQLSSALSVYERLLEHFPSGPLAENASVARLRILAKSDRARAKAEARRYLSRYPEGIARAEAQALLRER